MWKILSDGKWVMVPNKYSILSDKWWVMKIEWPKNESKQPLNSYKDRELKVGKAKWKKRKKSKCMKIAENHGIPLKVHKSLSSASTSFCTSRNGISGATRYCRLWNIRGSTSRSSKTAKVSQPSFCLWCNILQILPSVKELKLLYSPSFKSHKEPLW